MAQRNAIQGKARFTVTGYSPGQMLAIADAVNTSMKSRIVSAQDVYDNPAPPLKPNYAKWKARRYPPAIRNLIRKGETLAAMSVLSETVNRAIIGFVGAQANKVMYINQARSRQFGVSSKDHVVFVDAVKAAGPAVRIEVTR